MWKGNVVGRQVADGEHQSWYWAPWCGCISVWDSVRDRVASCVEEVEAMVENEETVLFENGGEGEGKDCGAAAEGD
jgi:hypothetical protein